MTNFKNGAIGTILTAPSGTSGTSTVLNSGQGSLMPTVPYYATAYPQGVIPNPTNWEIVQVTARSTDTLTIVRGQKGSTARTWAAGWILANGIYEDDLFSSSITYGETLTGTPNGATTAFTTASVFTAIEVFKNGVRMREGGSNDYTITAGNVGVTFNTAPATSSVLVANYIVGSTAMISGSNSLITDETPAGSVNSLNTAFTTANAYIPGSLQVFVNGMKQKRGTHFTESSPGTGGFTISDAPTTGDDVMVSYQFVQSTTGNADTVDGIHASSTATANQILPLNGSSKYPVSVLPSGSLVRLGQNSHAGSTLTTSYVTHATVTATSSGGIVEAKFEARVGNGNSGAVRDFTARVTCDGVAITPSSMNYISLYLSGSTTYLSYTYTFNSTPAAGAHTWNLQFLASAGSAVVVSENRLEINEVIA